MTPEEVEVLRLRARVDALEEALIWCSGSPSFAPEGEARVGWLKLCAPLLETPETSSDSGKGSAP